MVTSFQELLFRRKQISPPFCYFLMNNAFVYPSLANFLDHSKKMTENVEFCKRKKKSDVGQIAKTAGQASQRNKKHLVVLESDIFTRNYNASCLVNCKNCPVKALLERQRQDDDDDDGDDDDDDDNDDDDGDDNNQLYLFSVTHNSKH